jgi:hypothetical protein
VCDENYLPGIRGQAFLNRQYFAVPAAVSNCGHTAFHLSPYQKSVLNKSCRS